MKTILIIGHTGMLGNAAVRYFSRQNEKYVVKTLSVKFGEKGFSDELISLHPDYIINCAGVIPQQKPAPEMYSIVNVALPLYLDSLGVKVLHPSTDCEFLGDITPDQVYAKTSKRTAEDDYGKSKSVISEILEAKSKNTKIIRTSIIGHELTTNKALLEWFLSQKENANGYVNHYWNGITTLEWVKRAEMIMNSWESFPTLNQYGTVAGRSKFQLLEDIKDVYGVTTEITPFEAPGTVNKCLSSDIELRVIREQLIELHNFYKSF